MIINVTITEKNAYFKTCALFMFEIKKVMKVFGHW